MRSVYNPRSRETTKKACVASADTAGHSCPSIARNVTKPTIAMKVPRSPRVRSALADQRVVRQLLRQLGRPDILRQSPIAFRLVVSDHGVERKTLKPSAKELIRSVVRELPSRCQIVLERVDFDGQRIADVAKSLAISERQVYRDRAFAFKRIADSLTSESQTRSQQSSYVRQTIDAPTSYAHMLAQGGQLDLAAAVLLDIANASDDPRDRSSTYCALAHLALEQGSSDAARAYAGHAISSAMLSDGACRARHEVGSILGAIALRHNRPDAACQMLRRSCVGLQSLIDGDQYDRTVEALGRALILLSKSYGAGGHFLRARDAADEAVVRLSELSRPNRALQLEAVAQRAMDSHLVGENQYDAESELRECYNASISSGFILIALDVAGALATFYRLRGATDLALQLLKPLEGVCGRLASSRKKAYYYGAYATVLSKMGEPDLAVTMLSRAAEATLPGQPDVEARHHLVVTRTKLAAGLPLEAIGASIQAQLLLSELGRTSLVGVSFHLRGLALIALGRRREALQALRDAVDALSAGPPQARDLARNTLASLQCGGGRRIGFGDTMLRS